MKYSDEQRMQKIYDYAVRLHDYISSNGITKERLMNEVELQWLVTTPLYNIGEHVYNLSKEYKLLVERVQVRTLRYSVEYDSRITTSLGTRLRRDKLDNHS